MFRRAKKQERKRIFPLLETIGTQLDDADNRVARASAAATAAAAAATATSTITAAEKQHDNAYTEGWWDDLPEAPTGDASSKPIEKSLPPTPSPPTPLRSSPSHHYLPPPLPPPRSDMVPSAPPADEDLDWGGVSGPVYGGAGVGLGAGVGSTGGGVGGLAVKDAFRRLSLDQVRACWLFFWWGGGS